LGGGGVCYHVFGAGKGMRLKGQQRRARARNGGDTRSRSALSGSPSGNIVDLLVPELQRRDRFRTGYTGRTLRENLAS
jgi:hypothetical protein